MALIDWGDDTSQSATVDTAAGTVAGSHVYSSEGQYTVVVNLTDPTDGQFEIAINVVEPTIAPPVAEDSTIQVIENSTNGIVVGQATAFSPDGSGLSFELTGGSGESAFSIDPANGDIESKLSAIVWLLTIDSKRTLPAVYDFHEIPIKNSFRNYRHFSVVPCQYCQESGYATRSAPFAGNCERIPSGH